MREALPAHLASALPAMSTPAYVVDMAALKRNMAIAKRIRAQAGCRVLLATKSFALPVVFPLMREFLDGTTASGLFEARLGREEFGAEVHVYSPAYTEATLAELLKVSDHIYFNSAAQLRRFLPMVRAAGEHKKAGIRINPGYSKATLGGDLYDPCSPRSRFGVTERDLEGLPWDDIDILHCHSLCEALHDGSTGLISHVANEFAPYIRRVKAVNFGGGHFVCKQGYDVEALTRAIREFRAAFGVEVILEPGSGLVVDAGYLVTTVLDVVHNEADIAVCDASAACHMPDVLEVPYTPPLFGAQGPGVLSYTCILAGNTCMTGDVIGEYSFAGPIKPGDRLVFKDMLQYSFVKNNTFNGTPLPDLALLHEDGRVEVVHRFGYKDFRGRLG
ncbi:MAG TPA: carboxynorspermidine decarboxylase [Deltaproteobacteria bacterium]|nr:carboxynorspermidine decarboxylase [Deltaproteobacteria bacterium]HQI80722.1 carboxynorspermidine decarboxylase [Deltaproteobacteria bacterium]